MKSASGKETKSSHDADERLAIFVDTPITTTPDEIIAMVIDPPAWLETQESYGRLAERTLAQAGFVFESRELETRLLNDLAFPVQLREATQLLWAVNRLKRQTDDQQKIKSLSLEIGALGERIKARESEADAFSGRESRQRWKSGRDAKDRKQRERMRDFMAVYKTEKKKAIGTHKSPKQVIDAAREAFEALEAFAAAPAHASNEAIPRKAPSKSAVYAHLAELRKRSQRQ